MRIPLSVFKKNAIYKIKIYVYLIISSLVHLRVNEKKNKSFFYKIKLNSNRLNNPWDDNQKSSDKV